MKGNRIVRPLPPPARRAGPVVSMAVVAYLRTLTTALAHADHAQGHQGLRLNGFLEVAGTAAAIVIVYVLATWFFRYRDRADRDPDRMPRLNLRADPDHGHSPPGDLR